MVARAMLRRPSSLFVKVNNGTNTLTFMHQIEGFIDLFQTHGVSDEIAKLELTLHIPFNNTGQLRTPFYATECRPSPNPTGNQLEWTSGDFLTGPGNTDDH